MCAVDHDPARLGGTLACWSLDVRSGVLTPAATADLPGHGVLVRLEGRCAGTLCLPADQPAPTTAWAVRARQSIGGHTLLAVPGAGVHLFDAGGHWVRRLGTLGLEPSVIVFGRELIGWARGAQIDILPLDGATVDSVTGHVSVSLWSDDELLIANALGDRFIRTTAGGTTSVIRELPPTVCTRKQLAALSLGHATDASAACRASYERDYAPWVDAMYVGTHDGGLVMMRRHPLGDFVTFDASLREVSTIHAPWCH